LSPPDRRLDIDAVTIPRMIKVLSEEFDPAGRRLLFCESANLRLWPCRRGGLNCRIWQEIHWTSKDTAPEEAIAGHAREEYPHAASTEPS
jgi:hypothetical protein